MKKFTDKMNMVVEQLADPQSCRDLFREYNEGAPLPSGKVLEEIIELVRSIMFPGYYGNCTVNTGTLKFHLGVNIEKLHNLLIRQIQAGLTFADYRDVAAYAAYNEQTIANRLAEYKAKTLPVAQYYEAQGKRRLVDGLGTVEQIAARIEALLG